jgi:hypothetical protein
LIDTLSLIDAVMPDVGSSRKQASFWKKKNSYIAGRITVC